MKHIKKKLFVATIMNIVMLSLTPSINAQQMNMYINNQFVVRDMQSIGNYDMLPILDVAGELGFNCSYNNDIITLSNNNKFYTFTLGNASVYDELGNWYGLDVVPQIINNKIRIPSKFFQDNLGMSYTWDNVTNTIFINSDDTYNKFINTIEYRTNALQGWWFYYNDEPLMSHFSENLLFENDGSFYSQTWRRKCYGHYEIQPPSTIKVVYDRYFNYAGTSDYVYLDSSIDLYNFDGKFLYRLQIDDNDIATETNKYIHTDTCVDYTKYSQDK